MSIRCREVSGTKAVAARADQLMHHKCPSRRAVLAGHAAGNAAGGGVGGTSGSGIESLQGGVRVSGLGVCCWWQRGG